MMKITSKYNKYLSHRVRTVCMAYSQYDGGVRLLAR